MFTENFTISFDAISFGLKVLELDKKQLATVFTEDEIKQIDSFNLAFFEETVRVKTITEGVWINLDSFAIQLYDFIKGSINLMEMNDEEFDCIVLEFPYIQDRENVVRRMAEAKIILDKYRIHTLPKLF